MSLLFFSLAHDNTPLTLDLIPLEDRPDRLNISCQAFLNLFGNVAQESPVLLFNTLYRGKYLAICGVVGEETQEIVGNRPYIGFQLNILQLPESGYAEKFVMLVDPNNQELLQECRSAKESSMTLFTSYYTLSLELILFISSLIIILLNLIYINYY